MNRTAASFLTRCFAPDETIAILLRRENADRSDAARRSPGTCACAPLSWRGSLMRTTTARISMSLPIRFALAAANAPRRASHPFATYISTSTRMETPGSLRFGHQSWCPRRPSILSTSPGKYQVLWRVEGFDFARQEQTLKLLAIAFGGDPACTDCNRVLRIPGFLNCKYDPAHRVIVEYPDDSIWTPDDFHLDVGAVDAMLLADRAPPKAAVESTATRRVIGLGFPMSLLTAKTP